MPNHWMKPTAGGAALLLIALLTAGFWGAEAPDVSQAKTEAHHPRIYPDYINVVIPPNIAPMNFVVEEGGRESFVRIAGSQGPTLEVRGKDNRISLPEKRWKELLQANQGRDLRFDLFVRAKEGFWKRFEPYTNHVANEGVDSYLIYRKIHPSHNTWSTMGIYQRNLQDFQEVPVIENRKFGNDCSHCHAVHQNNPRYASLDIRSPKYGNSLLVISNNVPIKVNGNVSFSAWHPNNKMMVSSFNKPRLLLHTVKNDMRDIVELDGWLGYFFIDKFEVKRIPGLEDDARLLTFPSWAPDGKYLYFCSSKNPWVVPGKTRNENYQELRFDLMRISYQPETDSWGKPETLLTVAQTGLSMVQPQVSPDGRWLSFGMCDYGCWATYHPESDLYIADLRSLQSSGRLEYRKMELNSTECESWHSWSSNSRWIIFSSKRGNPLFSRPHLAYVDAQGHFQKPFVVPQEDPEFYRSYLKTYTIPTMAKEPFGVSEGDIAATIKGKQARTLILPEKKAAHRNPVDVVNPLDPVGNDAGRNQ